MYNLKDAEYGAGNVAQALQPGPSMDLCTVVTTATATTASIHAPVRAGSAPVPAHQVLAPDPAVLHQHQRVMQRGATFVMRKSTVTSSDDPSVGSSYATSAAAATVQGRLLAAAPAASNTSMGNHLPYAPVDPRPAQLMLPAFRANGASSWRHTSTADVAAGVDGATPRDPHTNISSADTGQGQPACPEHQTIGQGPTYTVAAQPITSPFAAAAESSFAADDELL